MTHPVRFQIGRWQNGGATSFSKKQRERMCIYLAGSDCEYSSVSRMTLVLEMPVFDHFLLFTDVHFYNGRIQRKRNNKKCFQRPSFPKLRQQGWLGQADDHALPGYTFSMLNHDHPSSLSNPALLLSVKCTSCAHHGAFPRPLWAHPCAWECFDSATARTPKPAWPLETLEEI